jgi:tetratricopeptide (TPR) repeat protein
MLENKDSYYYYSIGVEEFEKGNFDIALENLSISINIEPHFKTYQKQAAILEKLGRNTEAFEVLEAAYFLNPTNNFVAFQYAEKLFDKGKFDKCSAILNDIIDNNSTYNPAIKLLEKLNKQKRQMENTMNNSEEKQD